MKISCQTCQAKYTIADEKVLGKIVKIRCKKCSATIVINGNDSSTPQVSGGTDTGESAALGATSTWSVSVTDGDQRTMTEAEVVAAFRSGTVNEETYCWADGMGDWQPLRDIPSLASACGVGTGEPAPVSRGATFDETTAATRVGPEMGASFGADAAASQEAARRNGGRTAGVDLFGGAARAGAEDDVTTSAPPSVPSPPDADGRMTGHRNENSVLFSLAALTNTVGPNPNPKIESHPMAVGEGSGLIDIRALSAAMSAKAEPKKESSIDDIMNLSGGGAFAPALAAPVLGPPGLETEAVRAQAGTAHETKKNTGLMMGVGAAALVVILGGAAFFTMSKKSEAPVAKVEPTVTAPVVAATTAPPAETAPAPTTPPPAATAEPAPAPAAESATSKSAAASKETKSAAPSHAAPAPAAEHTAPAPVAAAAPETPAPASGSLEDEIRKSAAKSGKGAAAAAAPAAAAAGTSDQPFNMGEAKARLAAVAGSVQGCKKPDGPTGLGKVVVTFGPSGNVSSATVDGAPFEGTPTGACVASHFRNTHVPAFSGSPFTVKKSFSIN